VVEVADDGRGLDADKLISRAVQRGILKSTDKITASEAYALVFVAGFSTKEQVTGVSGRGVGMDVVKTNIESLGGTVEIDSHLGHGTTFRLILPLTLAIIEGLVVRSGEQRYVLPLSSVQEMVQVAPENVSTVQGRYKMMSVRGEWTPLFLLDDLVNKRGQCERLLSPRIALLIRTGEDGLLAAAVDDVVERQQVVIKSVRGAISKMRGVSGAAILGDGKVALILDVLELAAAAGIIKTKMLGAA
jgi:two-component system chemotaxis sensor kinase CheA